MRWLVLPMVVWTAAACVRGVYRGREWLLPACALLGLVLLAVQREGIMEGRYRKPVEPVFLAAIALSLNARARAADAHATLPVADEEDAARPWADGIHAADERAVPEDGRVGRHARAAAAVQDGRAAQGHGIEAEDARDDRPPRRFGG